MKRTMTTKQRKHYAQKFLEDDTACPFCGQPVEAETEEGDGYGNFSQRATCLSCGQHMELLYKAVDVYFPDVKIENPKGGSK